MGVGARNELGPAVDARALKSRITAWESGHRVLQLAFEAYFSTPARRVAGLAFGCSRYRGKGPPFNALAAGQRGYCRVKSRPTPRLLQYGEVAEWLNAPVLKTGGPLRGS